MNKYRIDDETIWEETDQLHFVKGWRGEVGICKVYREIKKGKHGYRLVTGSVYYPHKDNAYFEAMADCARKLTRQLINCGKFEENLKPIDE